MEIQKYSWQFAKNYVGTNRGRIYNLTTKRFAKRTVCGGSIGYWLNRNFYTSSYLNQTKIHIENRIFFATAKAEELPF